MGIEIERKFLVDDIKNVPFDSFDFNALTHSKILQGYLSEPGSGATVRIRLETTFCRGSVPIERAYITIKGPRTGIECNEFEYSILPIDAEKMMEMCTGPMILKDRHFAFKDGLKFEIDVFKGKLDGLVIAEVEFKSIDDSAKLEMPSWCVKDVSDDYRYTNVSLALNGIPK